MRCAQSKRRVAALLLGAVIVAAPVRGQEQSTSSASMMMARLPTWNSPPDWIAAVSSLNGASATGALGPGRVPIAELSAAVNRRSDRRIGEAMLDPQVRPSFYQDLAPIAPQVQQPSGLPRSQTTTERIRSERLFAGDARSTLILTKGTRKRRTASDIVLGIESAPRAASDLGSLLGKTSSGRGLTTQKRSPIITDPRIRGSRVGQLSASGSHWVPARIDLDTMVSKLDSRIIDDVTVIKGPYATRFGPGFAFLDIDILDSPRSATGSRTVGSTSLEYQTNGEQWYGRQSAAIGEADWGARFGYGHRTGSDYESGNDVEFPASYKSRDLDFAIGRDFGEAQNLELYFLRQDQTDVELPGQAFDLDASVTNAFGATWIDESAAWADRLEIDAWLNETRLKGNAQSSSKRRTFPFLNLISFTALTDVESISTGTQAEATWDLGEDQQISAGIDIRVVRQELEELSSGTSLQSMNSYSNRNSPIPRSASVNPGVYLELTDRPTEDLTLTAGVRGDFVSSEVLADVAQISNLGVRFDGSTDPVPLENILGSNEFDQVYGLWSAFLSSDYEVQPGFTLQAAVGHGQRAPSLTELYAAEPFMFLLQNGLNTVTGDPQLNPEKQTQLDLGVTWQGERATVRLNGFYAWVNDRITFERFGVACSENAMGVVQVEQVNLKYVNTDLATLIGFDLNLEYELGPNLVAFGTVGYVEGEDETRNGNFATVQRLDANPGQRFVGADTTPGSDRIAVRGSSQNGLEPFLLQAPLPGTVICPDLRTFDVPDEPLPGIPPLQAQIGVRGSAQVRQTRGTIELAVRIVDAQHRVASTLLEMPTAGYVVVDLRSVWQINERLTLLAGVENLTDEDYREHFDFASATGRTLQRPGVNFYFGSQVIY
ncbi:MAG: TonB-dependent receptor [Planctomycetes bacterium]|nr:TonB-dependent receptor [Planctomycetota bacterium]